MLSSSLKLAATLRLMAAPSLLDWSATGDTVGAGLLTVHVKVSVVVAPWASVAVTVTVYGLVADALAGRVPLIVPAALMLKPLGRPEAV